MNERQEYMQIINNSINRKYEKNTYHRHHILPESLFPLWDKKESNLVYLTFQEHFDVHRLLTLIYPGPKMAYAFHRLKTGYDKTGQPYKMTKEEFQRTQENYSKWNAWQLKKYWSNPENRKNQSLRLKGKKKSKSYSEKLKRRMTGLTGPDHPGYGPHNYSEKGLNSIKQLRTNEGIERRSNSDPFHVLNLDTMIWKTYQNAQKLIEGTHINLDGKESWRRLIKLATERFIENRISQCFKPMPNNSYVVTGKFTKSQLNNYARQIQEYIQKPVPASHSRKIIRGTKEFKFRNLKHVYDYLVSEGLLNMKPTYQNFKYHWYNQHDIFTSKYRYCVDKSHRNLIQKWT